MAKMSMGPTADELVVLFQSDSGAPILAQVPARPESDGDAYPRECHAGNFKSVIPMHNQVTENASPYEVAEDQYVAKKLQSEDPIPRRGGFLADGTARLQRAHQPVDAKYDPRPFSEVSPSHRLSAAVSRERAQLRARFSMVTPGSYTWARRQGGPILTRRTLRQSPFAIAIHASSRDVQDNQSNLGIPGDHLQGDAHVAALTGHAETNRLLHFVRRHDQRQGDHVRHQKVENLERVNEVRQDNAAPTESEQPVARKDQSHQENCVDPGAQFVVSALVRKFYGIVDTRGISHDFVQKQRRSK